MKDLLPSMEFEFEIKDLKGDDTGAVFNGKFKYKRLNIMEKSQAAKMRASLDEALNIPIEVSMLHEMIAWLRYGLIEYPMWWEEAELGMSLYDVNIVTEIYNKVRKFEENWTKKLTKKEPKKKTNDK